MSNSGLLPGGVPSTVSLGTLRLLRDLENGQRDRTGFHLGDFIPFVPVLAIAVHPSF